MNKEIKESEIRQFAAEIVVMKNKAGELGLYKTMHALEPATQAVGWEIAELIKRGKPWVVKR